VSTRSPEDSELEALLAREGRLARAWREASREEPSPATDAAVRAAARRAVHAGPRARHGPFSARWRVPLSVAALLVVSGTLTLLVAERREHVPEAALDAPSARPPAAPAAPPTAPAPRAEEQKSAEALAPDTAPGAGAPRARQLPVSPQAADESRKALRDAPEKRGTVAPHAAREVPPLESAPAPATPAAPAREYADTRAPAATQSRSDEGAIGEQDAAGAKKDPVPQALPQREREQARAKADAATEAVQGKREGFESGNALPPAVEPPLEPKPWLERILALRREGRLPEADRSLREFRRRYPDYPLPPELAQGSAGAPDNR
jgi:hypothetical protein